MKNKKEVPAPVPTRGRPRSFDAGDVMHKAQGLFLAHGFEALSYDAMADALGLSKPSLYNAFGTKEVLFARALDQYADRARAQIVADFAGAPNLRAATRKLLVAAAAHYAGTDGPARGCLLVGTSLPSCTSLKASRKTLTDFIQGLECSLARIIATEHKAEAAHMRKSPQALAMLVASLLFSLAVRARTGVSGKELAGTARALAAAIG